jgi:hypothetical protein
MSKLAKRASLVVVAVLLSSIGHAGPGGCSSAPWLVPFAFETITVSTTAIGFTTALFAPTGGIPADMAVATLETSDIRYRSDGINPTAAIGHFLASSSTLTACGIQSLRQVKFIRVTADGTLSVTYYRQTN